MCGIAGIFHFNTQPAEKETIQRMTWAMAHRGPDADSTFVEGQIALGHRRLSIIDLSDAANQPFTDNSGRYVIVFNGELYNFTDVKALLGDYPFKTNSDTEVLVAAYAKWGIECVHQFKGMFAFAVWDKLEKELTLVRDRLGVKPLYYYKDNDHFIFASEIRSILSSGNVKRSIDKAALQELFSYQSIGYPLSAIEDIGQLEAGSFIKVRNGHIDKKVYWDITTNHNGDFNFDDPGATKKRIRELLTRSVERRLVSDVPIGAFLSGGIDSSAVVGLMAEAGGNSPSTFTIGFTEKQFDESEYAATIAKKFNTRHTNIELKPTVFLDELENAMDAMDIPSADGINTYVVSKAIRNAGITVALSGVGGDELFAGYPFFKQYLQLQNKRNFYKGTGLLRKMGAVLLGGNSNRKQRMQQIIAAPSPDIEYTYPVSRQILSPALIRELTTFNNFKTSDTALFRQLSSKHASVEAFPLLSQVSLADYLGYTQHTLLKDTDQMSMAVALEVREPFFDHELIEFVLAIPDRLKFPVYPKSLLVESLGDLLPGEIVHRKKQGFVFPWNEWMKKELRSFCEKRLQRLGQRSFINDKALNHYWQRFLKNDPAVRWPELWIFVVLEHWMEKNNVNE